MLIRLFLIFIAINSNYIQAKPISETQVTKDVTFLASDHLAGRASFTEGSVKAADYIAKRFSEIGLSPLTGNKNFKQTFSLYQIKVESVDVVLNGDKLLEKDTLLFSSHDKLHWKTIKDSKILYIKATDDFAKSLSQFNQLNENVTILADSSHAEKFNRYKQYFSRPQNKFSLNQGPSALVLLSSLTNIESLTVKTQSSVKIQSLTNIIGVLPGKVKADEMVLFSAHYDHLGVNEQQDGIDKIYNGADDDASGTSAVINIAEYYSHKKNNQRSLVFIAFAAEELGGFGSRYFSENIEPSQITAMLNIEMIGKPSKFGAGEIWMTGFDRSNLAEILNKNLKDKQIYKDPYPKQQLFYRSDNATLARLGVPAHSFSSTQIDNDQHYHKVSDDVSTLNINSMTLVIQSLAEAVTSLVDGTDTPSRIDTKNVKPKGRFF
jgi:hypothetical protein